MKAGKTASEATVLAVSMLEDSPLTNAGVGSNLSLTGTVECDASVMDGGGGYGAVGAVQGVINPVTVAHKLLQESSQGCLSLGRVPPLMLVSTGAQQWARQHDIHTCDPDELITDRAREVYLDHKSRLDGASEPMRKRRRTSHRRQATCAAGRKSAALDTVGAICVDSYGQVAAGVSSGGISLKFPGRVGQAAHYGCGCWAEQKPGPQSGGVACSTSGTGEYIIRTMLAKECAIAMVESTLHQALDDHFINSKQLQDVEQKFKLAGVIALNISTDGVLQFSWGHTTESMCIGYLSSYHKEPTVVISKMDCPDKIGRTSHVEAIRFPSKRDVN